MSASGAKVQLLAVAKDCKKLEAAVASGAFSKSAPPKPPCRRGEDGEGSWLLQRGVGQRHAERLRDGVRRAAAE